jgi:hypothetical protein
MKDKREELKIYVDNVSRLEKELAETLRLHSSIAKDYGSELCPEDMIRQERRIEQFIKEAKQELEDFLSICRIGTKEYD